MLYKLNVFSVNIFVNFQEIFVLPIISLIALFAQLLNYIMSNSGFSSLWPIKDKINILLCINT